MILGACAGREQAEYPTSVQQHSPENDIAVEPEQSPDESKKPADLAKKERLTALLIEQNRLHTRMGKMEPELVAVCSEINRDCVEASRNLYRSNIPSEVIDKCRETLSDPEDTCVDLSMIDLGLTSELIAVYESINACLRKITEDCPADKGPNPTLDSGVWYGQEPKIDTENPY